MDFASSPNRIHPYAYHRFFSRPSPELSLPAKRINSYCKGHRSPMMSHCAKKTQSVEVLSQCLRKYLCPELSFLSLPSPLSCQWQYLLDPSTQSPWVLTWLGVVSARACIPPIPAQPTQPTTKGIFLRSLAMPVYASSENFLCYFPKNYVCSYPEWTMSSMEQEMWTFFSLGALAQRAVPKNLEECSASIGWMWEHSSGEPLYVDTQA